MHLTGADGDEPIYLFANAHWEPRTFDLPRLPAGKTWRRFVDTSRGPGEDALEPGSEAAAARRPDVRRRSALGGRAGRAVTRCPCVGRSVEVGLDPG